MTKNNVDILLENIDLSNFALDNNFVFLFEASPYRSEILKRIDQDFADLKQNRTNRNIRSLMNHVRQFTEINHVVVSIKPDYDNAFVMCEYSRTFSLDILKILKDYKFDSEKDMKVQTIQEPTKYITTLYVVFGDRFLSNLSPRELTAVLLHELGHCFNYTSNFPEFIIGLFRKIFNIIGIFPKILILPLLGFGLAYSTLITLVCLAIGRSLTFLEHRGEYKADQFVVKYGYGDELAMAFNRYYMEEQNVKKHYSFLKKVLLFLYHLFLPQSHPDLKSRIKRLIDQIINEYKDMYPDAKKELSVILSNLK